MIIEKVGLERQEVRRAGAAGAVVATGRQQPGARRAVGALTERPQRAGGEAMPGLQPNPSEWQKVKRWPCVACVLHLVLHV